MKNRTSQAPTGQGSRAKIIRALNQVRNIQVLINSLPKKIYVSKKNNIREIERILDNVYEYIERLY